jgi:hypothetical protein
VCNVHAADRSLCALCGCGESLSTKSVLWKTTLRNSIQQDYTQGFLHDSQEVNIVLEFVWRN